MATLLSKPTIIKEMQDKGLFPEKSTFDKDFKLKDYLKVVEEGTGRTVVEAQSTDDFPAVWYERQRYEVDAGREIEPTLYEPIYSITRDPNLARHTTINTLGPAGVVVEQIYEGGEVKFASMGSGSRSVEILHHGVGIEYSKDMLIYNELYRIPVIERRVGTAFNALLNHLHLAPILTATYAAANQTDGTALTSFKATADIAEKYARTLEQAIENATEDATNPRRGPYVLLTGVGAVFSFNRALQPVPQQGFTIQTDAGDLVGTLIAYNGWSGTRGKKVLSYAGVTSGKAYLINLGYQEEDFQSYVKQDVESQLGESDMSRFILEQVIYDMYLGVFANPERAVEEITLPVAASGAA